MGFTPQQMRGMSLWEYSAYLDGWRKAHDPSTGSGEDEGMTPELFRKLMDAPVRDYGVLREAQH
jgi:hypothetical protein